MKNVQIIGVGLASGLIATLLIYPALFLSNNSEQISIVPGVTKAHALRIRIRPRIRIRIRIRPRIRIRIRIRRPKPRKIIKQFFNGAKKIINKINQLPMKTYGNCCGYKLKCHDKSPVKDAVDLACRNHDVCVGGSVSGAIGKWCRCNYKFVRELKSARRKVGVRGKVAAQAMITLFTPQSCPPI